ncbi:MAG: glutaredoxin family protein [Candidatus Acidiferrales bacterium]|jgi:glutaredoxin
MPELTRSILATFDDLKRDTLDLHTFFELAAGAAPDERAAVLDAVAELVGDGSLEETGGDFYRRKEPGRLRLAGPLDVTLYTRPGCHLCEKAKVAMAPVLAEFRAPLREVDIDTDRQLREMYTNDVPVVFLGSRKVAEHSVDVQQLRRHLQEARCAARDA